MAVNYSATWTYIPSYLSISQLMQSGTSATSPEKIIYEEAITGKTAAFGEFHDQIRRLAYYLRHQLFLQPGDIVSISAASCIDYILVAHSVWWVGGIVSPINNSLHVDEIVHALNLIKPQVLVVDETLFGKLPQFLDTIGEHSLSIYTIGHKLNTKWTPLPVNGSSLDLEREPVLHSPITPRNFNARDTCAAILLSSGTTGAPKAVMLSHLNLVAVCYQLKSDNPDNWRGNQREIFFPPLSHVYGLYVCFTMNLWIGAYVCLLPRFEVGTYCRLLHERSATLARIVPAVARILAENPVVRQYEYPDLEYFSCSAAPLHKETAAKLRKVFPRTILSQTYGCTELTGPCVQSGVRNESIALSSVGTLISNSELRFLGVDGGECGARGPGEILFRGPNMMMGYKDNPKETSKTIKGEWLHTGDLGYLDENGYLYITGRLKELIKYKGFQVSPSELENIIIQHPLVKEAAVVGVWNSKEETEVPRAYIAINNSTERPTWNVIEELSQFVASKVSSYKRLRGVLIIKALPRNSNGKVLKSLLKENVQKHQTRRESLGKL